MCMMVYLASDRPLDLVADCEGVPFHVAELHGSELGVARQFRSPHVRYVGSYEGCGCGFQTEEYPGIPAEKMDDKLRSLDAFASYLEAQLERGDSLELYACWDGDQTAPPAHRRILTPNALRARDFVFLKRELSRIAWDERA